MTAYVPEPPTGSIISGTLRPEDLAPAFLDALVLVDPAFVGTPRYHAFVADVARVVVSEGEWDAEGEVLASLDDHINAVLPSGYRFGAHEGDGADFGIWEYDPEDY